MTMTSELTKRQRAALHFVSEDGYRPEYSFRMVNNVIEALYRKGDSARGKRLSDAQAEIIAVMTEIQDNVEA